MVGIEKWLPHTASTHLPRMPRMMHATCRMPHTACGGGDALSRTRVKVGAHGRPAIARVVDRGAREVLRARALSLPLVLLLDVTAAHRLYLRRHLFFSPARARHLDVLEPHACRQGREEGLSVGLRTRGSSSRVALLTQGGSSTPNAYALPYVSIDVQSTRTCDAWEYDTNEN